MKSTVWVAPCCAVLAIAYGCKSEPTPPGDDDAGRAGKGSAGASGKGAGGSSGKANAGGSSGKASSGGSSAAGNGGSVPQAGEGGAPDGSGRGGSAQGGSAGGGTSSGGSSNAGQSGADGNGATSAGGDAGNEGVTLHLPNLEAPDRDQDPLVFYLDDRLTTDGKSPQYAVNGAPGEVFTLVFPSVGVPSVVKLTSGVVSWTYQCITPTSSIAVNDQGEVYFSGSTTTALPDETLVGASDAVVGKLKANGTLDWIHQWGTSSTEQTQYVATGPDGAGFAVGTSGGQAPGNPPESAQGMWLARYERDGTRTYLKQYPLDIGNAATGLLIDPSGKAFVGMGSKFLRADAEGTFISILDAPMEIPSFFRTYNSVALDHPATWNSEHNAYYEWSISDLSGLAPKGLFKVEPSGHVEWYRNVVEETTVTDIDTGEYWTGHFSSVSAISATADSVYVTGHYIHDYELPGNPLAAHGSQTGFIGRYDLEGNAIWIQQFLIDQTGSDPGTPGVIYSVWPDVDGNPLVTSAFAGLMVFKLKKSDGTLM